MVTVPESPQFRRQRTCGVIGTAVRWAARWLLVWAGRGLLWVDDRWRLGAYDLGVPLEDYTDDGIDEIEEWLDDG